LSDNGLGRIAAGKDRLVLYPLDPAYRLPSPEHLAGFLVRCGFVAAPARGEVDTLMRPGENFMRRLTFVGCSPSVAMDENSGAYNNYSVRIIAPNNGLTIIAGNRVKSPVCPVCNRRAEGRFAADSIRKLHNQIAWVCPECEAIIPVEKINWRKKLAVASNYLEINGVFEGECIPADKFLQDLANETGIEWSYCYC
jgi:rubredoxin